MTIEDTKAVAAPAVSSCGPNGSPSSGRSFSIRERRGPWRDVLRRRLLAGADLASAAIVSLALVLSVRDQSVALVAAALFAPAWVLLAKLQGLYDSDHRHIRHLTSDELPGIVIWSTLGMVLLSGWFKLTGAAVPHAGALIRAGAALIVLAAALRAVTRHLWRALTPAERVVLVGSGALAKGVQRKLELLDDLHMVVVATVDDELLSVAAGAPEELAALLAPSDDGLGRIVLACDRIDSSLVTDLVNVCRARSLKLSLVPPAGAQLGGAVQLAHVGELPIVEYGTWDVSRSTALLKRTLDVGLSVILLVALAPALVTVAIWIRLDSAGRALYVQKRAGRNGQPFKMWKFRTMEEDAELKLAALVELASLPEPVFKIQDDPRITRAGRHLRRWSIDELPQLWNVLRGDMSLVGPRPEQVDLAARYSTEQRIRLAVKPGITGPMQICGRGDLGLDERVAAERAYIESMSLWGDLRILLQTVAAVVRGRGAY